MTISCFISHTWQGNQHEFAKYLSKRLNQHKDIKGWLDENEIIASDPLYERIQKALENETNLTICILSPEYLQSDNCKIELDKAYNLYKKKKHILLPLLLFDINMPIQLEGLVYADFRGVVDDQGNINKDKFYKAFLKLVNCIRYSINRKNTLERKDHSKEINISESTFISRPKTTSWNPKAVRIGKAFELIEIKGQNINFTSKFIKSLNKVSEKFLSDDKMVNDLNLRELGNLWFYLKGLAAYEIIDPNNFSEDEDLTFFIKEMHHPLFMLLNEFAVKARVFVEGENKVLKILPDLEQEIAEMSFKILQNESKSTVTFFFNMCFELVQSRMVVYSPENIVFSYLVAFYLYGYLKFTKQIDLIEVGAGLRAPEELFPDDKNLCNEIKSDIKKWLQ